MGAIGLKYITNHLGHNYQDLLDYVMLKGDRVQSRYGETRELLNFTLHLQKPINCVVDRTGFSRRFMYAEIDQFLAGVHDGDILKAVSPQAASMITEKTNYGVRIGRQLATVVDELVENPDSRRAVAYVGESDDLQALRNWPAERHARANEIACACVWHFIVRDDQVHMFVYGRSWDMVWGLCYDIPSCVAVQAAVAAALGKGTGDLVFTAGSAHIYERHYKLETRANPDPLSLPWLVSPAAGGIRQIQKDALLRMVEAHKHPEGPKGYYGTF